MPPAPLLRRRPACDQPLAPAYCFDDDGYIPPGTTGMGYSVAVRQDMAVQIQLFPHEAGIDTRQYPEIQRGRVDLVCRQLA